VRAPYSPSKTGDIISENNFELGLEDPEGLRRPFGAHIPRANPCDSLSPGSIEQIDISNRHRILRIGRQYRPGPGEKPGLLGRA
jgi:deferrochelatase/peroxidase EfeB